MIIMLDNRLSNDEYNRQIPCHIEETKTEKYISKKYNELALSHLKQQILSQV